MSSFAGREDELEFPLEVHFRIVCDAGDEVEASVRQQAASMGLAEGLVDGNQSRGGKYRSFQLSTEVASREELRGIDAAFRGLPGVKMVL